MENIIIRKAREEEFEAERQFYHAVTDDMRSYDYDIGWEKDVYPSPSFLYASISNGELFVAVVNEEIVAAMVVNHECNEGYQKVNWKQTLNNGQFTVIHALCVATKMSGHGIAKAMVRHAIDYSRQMGMKAVRLDVFEGDVPASHLYQSQGFIYQGSTAMYYPDTGWTNFDLFEYPIAY